jgi:hypothetical protein
VAERESSERYVSERAVAVYVYVSERAPPGVTVSDECVAVSVSERVYESRRSPMLSSSSFHVPVCVVGDVSAAPERESSLRESAERPNTSSSVVNGVSLVPSDDAPRRGRVPTKRRPSPMRRSARRGAGGAVLANSRSRSVSDVVRRMEELRLGAITRVSPGYRYDADVAESALSSMTRG